MGARPPDPIERARALRAQGIARREIAATLGVSPRTVARWSATGTTERSRDRSRQAKRSRRAPCGRCSAPLSYDRPGGLCRACRRTDAEARLAQVARLYDAGQDPPQIARGVGISDAYTYELLHRLARSGRIQPRWALRDHQAVHEREQQILALRAQGHTHAQIAQALKLRPASVNQALVRLRARGDRQTA
jgi:DNA-binding CsgD family transcriptional regulator